MITKWMIIVGGFVSIYGSLYLFLFLRMRNSGIFSGKALYTAGFFMSLMVFGPIFIPNSYFIPWHWVKMGIAYIVYLSMGFIVLFFAWSFILSVCTGVVNMSVRFRRGKAFELISPRNEFFLQFGFSLLLLVYGFLEAMNPRLERVRICDSRIPPGNGIRIVMVSDIHLGVMENVSRLKRILNLVKENSPDLLLCAGDLVDFEFHDLPVLSGMLREIRPPLGKLAVLGNHEFIAGLEDSLNFLSESGFDTLRGETREITPFLSIVGFDDPSGVFRGQSKAASEPEILNDIGRNKYVVLMRHQPDVGTGTLNLFDLQISGHTHGGQIFPLYYFTRLVFNFPLGLSRLGNRSWLYLTRGSGTFGPPVRVFAPSEVTVIELVNGSRR